jgi:hypothetical protein
MAANNKCLADSNKTRAENKATNRRLHPGTSAVVQMHTHARDRVSSLPRWRGPTSGRCAHPSGEKELRPCLAYGASIRSGVVSAVTRNQAASFSTPSGGVRRDRGGEATRSLMSFTSFQE